MTERIKLLEVYREAARKVVFSDEDIAIDDRPDDIENIVSISEEGDGAWVRAWVWVPDFALDEVNNGRI